MKSKMINIAFDLLNVTGAVLQINNSELKNDKNCFWNIECEMHCFPYWWYSKKSFIFFTYYAKWMINFSAIIQVIKYKEK